MRAALTLECIGDNLRQYKLPDDPTGYPRRAWVAEITACVGQFLCREYLDGQRDYAEANSVGSRGVKEYFWLDEGLYYEVNEPLSWKRDYHYFCTVRDGEIVELTREQVVDALKTSDFDQWAK